MSSAGAAGAGDRLGLSRRASQRGLPQRSGATAVADAAGGRALLMTVLFPEFTGLKARMV